MEKKKEKKNKKNKILTSVRISADTHEYIKNNMLRLEHLIELGIRAHRDNPQILHRMHTTEEEINVLKERLRRHTEQIYRIEEAIKKA